MSVREPTPPSNSNSPTPLTPQRIARAASAPPNNPAASASSVSALVASITSAVDRAEGMQAQRMEVLQRELIKATTVLFRVGVFTPFLLTVSGSLKVKTIQRAAAPAEATLDGCLVN